MQQTRIAQGWSYYLRFIERFPDVEELAGASQDEVLRYWQGLGYYSRGRNLHKAAQMVVEEYGGVFPQTFEELKKLPGVGEYTAAAIASFAYGQAHPVVDGNVKRVLSRYCGYEGSIDDPSGHKEILALATKLMKGTSPADFNQAIMNFGALVCTPKNAQCAACPLSSKCYAYKNDCVDRLPVRTKKKTNTNRYFHFIVLTWKGKILMTRRGDKDIWRGLYTPLLIETRSTRKPSPKTILAAITAHTGTDNVQHTHSTETTKQLLSHQTIHGRFHHYTLIEKPGPSSEEFVWVTTRQLDDFPRPKMVVEGV